MNQPTSRARTWSVLTNSRLRVFVHRSASSLGGEHVVAEAAFASRLPGPSLARDAEDERAGAGRSHAIDDPDGEAVPAVV